MDTGKGHYHMDDAVKFRTAAENSIGIPDPKRVYAYRIKVNASILKEEIDRIKGVEREIEERMSANNDVKNISDIHGIAMTSAAVMVAEIGSIGQFSSAVKLQSYGGESPNITGSGGKIHSSGSSKIRNPHLPNSTYECAVSIVLHRTPEFLSIYQREIAKKKKPTQAYIVVGKRLLSHVYSIMKNQKPYRERLPGGSRG